MDSDDGCVDEYDYYNEDDDDDDEDIGIWNDLPPQGTYCGFRPSFLFSQNYTLPSPRYITQEEADRNAKELLEEEEREKEKADKKREKKKRQKDRKRQQKLQEAEPVTTSLEEKTVTWSGDSNGAVGKVDNEDAAREDSIASASDDDLDLRSTFVLQAQKKMENKPKPERRERMKEASREEPSQERGGAKERIGTQPPPPSQNNMNILDRFKIQESLDLANIGNNMASRERFTEALHYYTEAIKLNPMEYRFLGNRSYVYERLGCYDESLGDAENSLKLQKHFLKGHFRKGKALKGLKRYLEAVAAFQEVLSVDVNHVEAAREILQCQQKMQETMASTRVKILSTAPLRPLAPPPAFVPAQNNKVFVPRNIYNTKFEANKSVVTVSNGPAPEGAANVVIHSKLYPIWVGNVTNTVTESALRHRFQAFGVIHSVRILYSRTCAFINFTNKESAEAAYQSLQGLVLEGSAPLILQLRNPDHNTGGSKKTGK